MHVYLCQLCLRVPAFMPVWEGSWQTRLMSGWLAAWVAWIASERRRKIWNICPCGCGSWQVSRQVGDVVGWFDDWD